MSIHSGPQVIRCDNCGDEMEGGTRNGIGDVKLEKVTVLIYARDKANNTVDLCPRCIARATRQFDLRFNYGVQM